MNNFHQLAGVVSLDDLGGAKTLRRELLDKKELAELYLHGGLNDLAVATQE